MRLQNEYVTPCIIVVSAMPPHLRRFRPGAAPVIPVTRCVEPTRRPPARARGLPYATPALVQSGAVPRIWRRGVSLLAPAPPWTSPPGPPRALEARMSQPSSPSRVRPDDRVPTLAHDTRPARPPPTQ